MVQPEEKRWRITGTMDPSWRKSRIAARILLRKRSGTLSARDIRLAARLYNDPGVTDRLIDQALASLSAPRPAYS